LKNAAQGDTAYGINISKYMKTEGIANDTIFHQAWRKREYKRN